jgi:hypothetical protein
MKMSLLLHRRFAKYGNQLRKLENRRKEKPDQDNHASNKCSSRKNSYLGQETKRKG